MFARTMTLLTVLLVCLSCAAALAPQPAEQNPAALRARGTRTRPSKRDAIIAQRQANPRKMSKRDYCPAGPRSSAIAGQTCSCSISGQCNGMTIDFGTDPNNCGGCNQRCGTGQSCASGFCTTNPVTFQFRIEGSDSEGTIYEGPITTSGHVITTPSGGTHQCDGTNNNANPAPGGTATTAIDDAGRCAGFGFDGSYSSQFSDFFITKIGNTASTGNQFWGILRNRVFTARGGCQEQGVPGDELLWAFDAFSPNKVMLYLTGPTTVTRGQPATYTVQGTDPYSGNNSPASGANLLGQTADANGQVILTFNTAGMYNLKVSRYHGQQADPSGHTG